MGVWGFENAVIRKYPFSTSKENQSRAQRHPSDISTPFKGRDSSSQASRVLAKTGPNFFLFEGGGVWVGSANLL